MARTVTIPENYKPFYTVWVNGVKYELPAGETVEVPDGVADVIENDYALDPKEDPRKGNMIIKKTVKVIPGDSRFFVAHGPSGGEIHDPEFAEFLWENRKFVKLISSEKIDMSTANSYKEDETFSNGTRRIYGISRIDPTKRYGFFVTITPDGIIQYGDMGQGDFDKGWIIIPDREDVTIETSLPSTPFVTFYGTVEEMGIVGELPRVYLDEERTVVAREEDVKKAYKNRNICLKAFYPDMGYIEFPPRIEFPVTQEVTGAVVFGPVPFYTAEATTDNLM